MTAQVVVDASVLVDALTSGGPTGDRARAALRGVRWAAPEHVRVEVFHAVRGRWLAGTLDRSAAGTAVHRLAHLAVETVPSAVLLNRMWELRDNLSGYDAAYVAAAEHLGAKLVTADRRLNAAPGLRCGVVVV